jgi:hypothetical protein
MAISERSVIEAMLLAIDEINENGGVLGRPVEAVVEDGESDSATFKAKAEKLIKELRSSAAALGRGGKGDILVFRQSRMSPFLSAPTPRSPFSSTRRWRLDRGCPGRRTDREPNLSATRLQRRRPAQVGGSNRGRGRHE